MNYDVIIVGGGLGGSALAKNLAERKISVLLVEREPAFKDRVRGEQMHPWGVTDARALGIYDAILDGCGRQTRWWVTYAGSEVLGRRDLQETSPHGVGSFNFYHPSMQEILIRLAEIAGAEVRRALRVSSVIPGDPPTIQIERNGNIEEIRARLVVCADGRNSGGRSWGDFAVHNDPDRLMIAGTLIESTPVPDDSTYVAVGPEGALLMAPQGRNRARTYFMYRKADGLRRLSGDDGIPEFLACCRSTGIPAEWLDGTRVAGPLAQFNGANHWVNRPARDGVVLIGDAAAASDPSWGSGLSLTLRDVRDLRDRLLNNNDWKQAAEEYASDHDERYEKFHGVEKWWAELIWSTGPVADERRFRILPTFLTDPAGLPDLLGLGPDSPPADEAAWRFLGL